MIIAAGVVVALIIIAIVLNKEESDADLEARLRGFHQKLDAGQDPWAT